MIFIIISIILFLFGFFISFKIKAGYKISAIASIFAFLGGLAGIENSFKIFNIPIALNLFLTGRIDKFSAIFLIFLSIAWFFISIFSIQYGYNHGKSSGTFLNLTFLGMLITVIAGDCITFLIGWELMTVFIFLMMLAEKEVKFKDAFAFIAFGEVSSIFLIAGFSILFLKTNSTDFTFFSGAGKLFIILTSIGFIIKMDIVPFHTWMKNVYDKAPTNVCAILSGPVTLLGVYGLIRVLKFSYVSINPWFVILLAIGGLSAFWGALHAVATGGLKILPAYSTVENNGIILSAISFSFLVENSYLSNFALAAALIVAFGHLLAKTLLFVSIGHAKEVYNAHTIDEVKGVWNRVGAIPALGIIIAGVSLSAFPPLIGYVGEWMVLESIFQSFKFVNNFYRFFGTSVGVLIALGIGLTGFSMVKLIGYTALGYHHEKKVKQIPDRFIKFSEVCLIFLVIFSGVFAPVLFKLFGYSYMLGGALGVPEPFLIMSGNPIFGVIAPTFLFIVIGVLFLFPFSIYILTRKKVRKVNSFNGAILLKEEEYFTAQGYSYILEHILSKIYRTKEIIKNRKFIIEIYDILTFPFKFCKNISISTGFFISKYLMNGKIYWYIIYILIMFIICFLIIH